MQSHKSTKSTKLTQVLITLQPALVQHSHLRGTALVACSTGSFNPTAMELYILVATKKHAFNEVNARTNETGVQIASSCTSHAKMLRDATDWHSSD